MGGIYLIIHFILFQYMTGGLGNHHRQVEFFQRIVWRRVDGQQIIKHAEKKGGEGGGRFNEEGENPEGTSLTMNFFSHSFSWPIITYLAEHNEHWNVFKISPCAIFSCWCSSSLVEISIFQFFPRFFPNSSFSWSVCTTELIIHFSLPKSKLAYLACRVFTSSIGL